MDSIKMELLEFSTSQYTDASLSEFQLYGKGLKGIKSQSKI